VEKFTPKVRKEDIGEREREKRVLGRVRSNREASILQRGGEGEEETHPKQKMDKFLSSLGWEVFNEIWDEFSLSRLTTISSSLNTIASSALLF
jgi:hypothetical protein